MMTALITPLLFAAAGGAIDYTNRARVRSALQEAADAAALAAAYAHVHEQNVAYKAQQAASRTFSAQITDANLVQNLTRNLKRSGTDFTYTVEADVKTGFMDVVGIDKLPVAVSSTARIPTFSRDLEMAIVIDTTNSMGFDNTWDVAMDALADVVDQLRAHVGSDKFNVTLVPYADRVNVDNADWLDGAAPNNWNGCMEPREVSQGEFPYALTDAAPEDPEAFQATIPNVTGGLAARGGGYPKCPNVEITGPTDDPQEIADAAKRFQRNGTGRFDVGLAWGWRALSTEWRGEWGVPDYPADPEDARKIAVFITDGRTTAYKWEMSKTEDWGWNNGSKEGFEHLVNVCTQMKQDGIEIFVFRTPGNSHSEPYFQDCATSANHYRTISNNTDLKNAFGVLIDEDQMMWLVK
ncbi:MAG: vWA domain-containing protein [Pseudomonadota bacterium]